MFWVAKLYLVDGQFVYTYKWLFYTLVVYVWICCSFYLEDDYWMYVYPHEHPYTQYHTKMFYHSIMEWYVGSDKLNALRCLQYYLNLDNQFDYLIG